MKFGFDWQAVSEKKMFENNGHINVLSPKVGEDNALGYNIFIFVINIIIQSI